MSPYRYDYSLAPRASTGWRSRFATVMTVGAIAAISAVSGAAVALNLLGTSGATADRPAAIAVSTPVHPASAPAAQSTLMTQTVARTTPQPAKAQAPVAPAPAAAAQPASPPAAAPGPQAVPAVATIEPPPTEHVTEHVAEKELTFTRGYARRRAVQAAAEAASGAKSDKTKVARVEAQGQLGRPATKIKPRAVARATAPSDQRRVAEMREEGGPFSRFEQPERFDFGRHQALAFGESRDSRSERRPPPRGGPFGNSPGGFFGGLF